MARRRCLGGAGRRSFGMRIYAIGDIHGQLAKLADAHRQIAIDRERTGDGHALVIHLGDLVDRGPDSKGVIDYLIDGIETGEPWRVIKGNHDRMFCDFVQMSKVNPRRGVGLRYLDEGIGGSETLMSYGVARGLFTRASAMAEKAAEVVPTDHLRFLETLPLYHKAEGLLFVHAGIQPGVPLEYQTEQNLIWIREPFLTDQSDHGVLVVHGHTPVNKVEHHGNRLAIDTGAGFGGPVTAVIIEDGAVFELVNGVRRPVEPM